MRSDTFLCLLARVVGADGGDYLLPGTRRERALRRIGHDPSKVSPPRELWSAILSICHLRPRPNGTFCARIWLDALRIKLEKLPTAIAHGVTNMAHLRYDSLGTVMPLSGSVGGLRFTVTVVTERKQRLGHLCRLESHQFQFAGPNVVGSLRNNLVGPRH